MQHKMTKLEVCEKNKLSPTKRNPKESVRQNNERHPDGNRRTQSRNTRRNKKRQAGINAENLTTKGVKHTV